MEHERGQGQELFIDRSRVDSLGLGLAWHPESGLEDGVLASQSRKYPSIEDQVSRISRRSRDWHD